MSAGSKRSHCYGLTAEFASARGILEAVRASRGAGYDRIEAYTPYAVDGLAQALGLRKSPIPLLTLIGGLLGAATGWFLQWYSAVIDYPINSGGRPLNSWPAFVPSTIELGILGACICAFGSMLWFADLPRLRHPMFDTPGFEHVSRDRFFLCIRSEDPLFDLERTHAWLMALAPLRVATTPMNPEEPA
ncbi:MAG TPA: DUF3341 domain-containing protein [Steroidobacteraceae bacterium]